MLALLVSLLFAEMTPGQDQLLVIQGAAGTERFAPAFEKASQSWLTLAEKAEVPALLVKPDNHETPMKERIRDWLTSPEVNRSREVWIVYIGHGTSNQTGSKLNLAGEDISSSELASWLDGYEGLLVCVIGSSASSPFITDLAGPNRIVITATRSPSEVNYARFGELFAAAIGSPQSDLDLDGAVSVLEAFIAASSAVETFYEEAGRLASEHALIEDNGDGIGQQASAFTGLRPNQFGQDGALARRVAFQARDQRPWLSPSQVTQRNRLETQLEQLRDRQDELAEDEYFAELERILDGLAELYREPEDS